MSAPVQTNPFVALIAQYAADPVAMVVDLFGVTPDPWQQDVLRAYGRRERRITVRSAHGVGKTAVAAWMAIHHALTRAPSKCVMTAPSSSTLWDALWTETVMWMRRLPPDLLSLFTVKSDRIELTAAPEEVFISARTSRADQPEALQGVHSESVLLIVDEASGVPEPVYEAAIGSMSGATACTILISNPTKAEGTFFQTHTRMRDRWFAVHVPASASRRVAQDFVDDVAARYGEDSNAYRVRVLGEFPTSDDDVVIPRGLIIEATQRDIQLLPTTPRVWGLDIARFGNDRSALVERQRTRVTRVVTWKNKDLMALTGVVKLTWDDTPPHQRPEEILADVIGMGAGVVDRLRELGLPVRGINVSESPAFKDRYRALRDELWFTAKEWFARRDCAIPDHVDLVEELAAVHYGIMDSNGKLVVESKESQKKTLRRSPDVADAFVLTFAGEAGTMLYGTSYAGGHQPLRRNVRAVV